MLGLLAVLADVAGAAELDVAEPTVVDVVVPGADVVTVPPADVPEPEPELVFAFEFTVVVPDGGEPPPETKAAKSCAVEPDVAEFEA